MYIADILWTVIAWKSERARVLKWNTVEIFYRGLLWNCFKLKDFAITTLEKKTIAHNKVPTLQLFYWSRKKSRITLRAFLTHRNVYKIPIPLQRQKWQRISFLNHGQTFPVWRILTIVETSFKSCASD
jgi:uncharacterized paraquat-inducible protein A